MKYTFILYYKKEAVYREEIININKLLQKIYKKWKVPINTIELEKISDQDADKLIMEFRNIQPQIRGRIVTSKGRILPLSKGKKLNLDNTPILVVKTNGISIDVYPHLLGTHYFDIKTFLENMLKSGVNDYFHSKGYTGKLKGETVF